MCSLLECDRGSIFVVDHVRRQLYTTIPLQDGKTKKIYVSMRTGVAGYVAQTGEPCYIDDAYLDERFNSSVDEKTGYKTRNLMCVPIPDKHGRVIAVSQVINKNSVSSSDTENRLQCDAYTIN